MAGEKKKISLQDMNIDMNPEWNKEEEENKDAEIENKLIEERKKLGKKLMRDVE